MYNICKLMSLEKKKVWSRKEKREIMNDEK